MVSLAVEVLKDPNSSTLTQKREAASSDIVPSAQRLWVDFSQQVSLDS